MQRPWILPALIGLACAPEPAPPVTRSSTDFAVAEEGDFAFAISRLGDVVGRSSTNPSCPPLAVALRLPDNSGWVDVTDAEPRNDVETLSAVRAVRQGDVVHLTLADRSGVVRGAAKLDIVVGGDDDFLGVNVSFPDLDEADVAYVSACFALAPTEHLVGGGERFDGPDLRGKITPLVFSAPASTASGTNEAHVPVPFFATTRGLGVLVESERVGAFDASSFADSVQVRFLGTSLPLRLRAANRGANVVVDNVAAHARKMGLPKPPPRWALAPMQWRNDLEVAVSDEGEVVSSGADMLLGDVAEMTERGLPFSAVWIDAPWETGYNTFVVNDVQLPDFDAVMQELDDHGLHALVWATEHVNTSDDSDQMIGMPRDATDALFADFRERGFLVATADGTPFTFPWGRGTGAFVDFSNPEACRAWQESMTPLLRRGVRGFKLDYGESMRPDLLGLVENTVPVFHDGSTTQVQHTRYARLYHECYIGALEAVHGDDWFIITRTGGIFDQKNGVAIWPGDIDSGFNFFGDVDDEGEADGIGGIPSGIHAYLSLAMSGYPLFGADIGGYRGPRASPEALARWADWCSFSTIFQMGGGSNQAPWDPDYVDAADAFASAAHRKMELWPMFEVWIARASAGGDGTPVVVPLGVAAAEDADAWADSTAFVLGDVLAVFPVVVDGARTRVVHVPPGDWRDFATGESVRGVVEMDAPLGTVPTLVRAGGVLVLDPASETLLGSDLRQRDEGARRVVVAPGDDVEDPLGAGGLFVSYDDDARAVHVRGEAARVEVQLLGSGLVVDEEFDGDEVFVF